MTNRRNESPRAAARRKTRARAMARMLKRRGSGGFSILPLLACLALLAAAAGAVHVGHTAELRQREALALRCAINSEKTDSAIADCYTSRDLPLPEDI